MTPELDEIHALLDRQMDAGTAFAQLKCLRVRQGRNFDFHDTHLARSHNWTREMWILRTFANGAWGTVSAGSFAELRRSGTRSAELAKEMARQGAVVSTLLQDLMVSKPIRQLSAEEGQPDPAPEFHDLLDHIETYGDFLPRDTALFWSDECVSYSYWDTDHTRGRREYFNAALELIHRDAVSGAIRARWRDHFHCDLSAPASPLGGVWRKRAASWAERIAGETFQGPASGELPVVLTPRAFAQLIQGTLVPVLALERPDPFCGQMNPATLLEKNITPACFTLHSQPGLVSSVSFLDQEGVPARRVPLIDKGRLSSLLFSRSSAFHLGRSLPVQKEKILAGSSGASASDQTVHPDLRHAVVAPGDSFSETMKASHLLVGDLTVERADFAGSRFLITFHHSLVSLYDGIHRRHLPEVSLCLSRAEIWDRLEAVADACETVFLPPPAAFQHHEPYAAFSVPFACFRGDLCTLS